MKTKCYPFLTLLTAIFWLSALTPASSQVNRKNIQAGHIQSVSSGIIQEKQDLNASSFSYPGHFRDKAPKSPDYTFYRPDTITSYSTGSGNHRDIYTYNLSGRLVNVLTKQRPAVLWQNYANHSYTFDASGNMVSELYQNWENNAWVNTQKYTNTYNGSGQWLTELLQEWVGGNWQNLSLETFTFDGNGRMHAVTVQNWDGSSWVNSDLWTFIYNENGTLATETDQMWFAGNWVNTYQYQYTYDPQNNLLTVIWQEWDGMEWANTSRDSYTYDDNSNNLTYLMQNWDSGAWLNFSLTTNTYDALGNQLTILGQSWESGAWLNYEYMSRTYDGSGNMLSQLYQVWSGSWENASYALLTYNIDNNLTSRVDQMWTGFEWQNYTKAYYNYTPGYIDATAFMWNGTGWQPGECFIMPGININGFVRTFYLGYASRAEVFYSTFTVGVAPEIPQSAVLSVYPNPVRDNFRVTTKFDQPVNLQLTLTDLSGRTLAILYDARADAGPFSATFSAPSLSPGLYLLRLTTPTTSFQQKLFICPTH